MIKATPNYPLCISARPGPSWCVRGLFWKRDKLTSAKIFADVCSRMRGVIPASPSGKFSVGCLFPHARGDPSLTPGKIFPRVLHPFFRLQSLHLLQPLCVLKTLPRPTASATLSRASPPGPAKIFAGVSFSHIVAGFSLVEVRKILRSCHLSATLSLLSPASPPAKFCTGFFKRLFINMWAEEEEDNDDTTCC